MLVDYEGLSSDYILNINVEDNFVYQPERMKNIILYYPRVANVNISKLLLQFIDHRFVVSIQEKNKVITWAKYEANSQSIIFSNYEKIYYGEHILVISIFDEWFSRYFNSTLISIISFSHPPSVTGNISNITAYQGQEVIGIKIHEGVFYKEYEEFSIVFNLWTDAHVDSKSSLTSIVNINPDIYYEVKFKKIFIGSWESNLIAVDLNKQASLIKFYINVLKWPQIHWLYWNGPNTIEWIEWIPGFFVYTPTGEWRILEFYFDSWVIISFAIVVLLMTILSDHDVNASYILLESITLYWMLFLVFDDREWRIKQYFNQLQIVITHLNSASFPLFSSMFSLNKNTNVTNSFLINWATIIALVFIFLIFQVYQKISSKFNKIAYLFRTPAISKYLQWALTYTLFWIIFEMFSFEEFTSSRVLSYIIWIIFLWFTSLFIYWFVVYSNKNWWIWSRYHQIYKLRLEFTFFDCLIQENYAMIVRYNITRKLLLSATIIMQIKIKMSPFLLTFVIIWTQSMYSNLITGLWQFKSLTTRVMMIFNEIMMVAIMLLASVEYLNEFFNTSSYSNKFENLLLMLIRFHILSILGIEFFRMCRFIILKISRIIFDWIQRRNKDKRN